MKKEEFAPIFEYIFCEEAEIPSDQVRLVFWDQFGKLGKEEFMLAARAVKQRKTFGTPKCSDVWEVIKEQRQSNLPETLRISGGEALALVGTKKLLISDAARFANRVAPGVDDRRQFGSPEELAKANQIAQAVWEREFKDRFERKQGEALRYVNRGLSPKDAILAALGMSDTKALPDVGKKVLDAVFSRPVK